MSEIYVFINEQSHCPNCGSDLIADETVDGSDNHTGDALVYECGDCTFEWTEIIDPSSYYP